MKIKKGIDQNERLKAIEWAYEYFKHVADKKFFFGLILQETNWDVSIKLVNDDNEILGLYLFGDQQLSSLVKDTKYDELNGVEGVLLVVDKSIRNEGWGNSLKDASKTLGFDYIWGQQLKSLNNLNDWLKRRILVCETDDCYITLEKFV